MTMKNIAKFEEESTWHFKTDIKNLTNFRKSKKIARELVALTKEYNVWSKKSTEQLCLALTIDAKFEGKVRCAFKNDMRNLANMHRLK